MESIRGKEFLHGGNILRHPVFVLFLAGAFLGAGASLLLSSSLPPPEADECFNMRQHRWLGLGGGLSRIHPVRSNRSSFGGGFA